VEEDTLKNGLASLFKALLKARKKKLKNKEKKLK
jgi:hypothetical protein